VLAMPFGRVVMIVQQRLRRCEYASFSYFPTGENRAYSKDLKVLDRVHPLEPFLAGTAARGVGRLGNRNGVLVC
jgi:phosphate-selective porin